MPPKQYEAGGWGTSEDTPKEYEATELPTLSQSIQEAVTLVDRLKAAPADPGILADLIKAIHRAAELQERLAPKGRQPDNTEEYDKALDADNLQHIIHAAKTKNQEGSICDRLGFCPDLHNHLRAQAMEHYGLEYEVLIPRLTSGIALACFGYEVITHQFPQPFIVRGVKKYSGDMKPDLWLSDYLKSIKLAHGNNDNALRHFTLCL